DVRRERRVGKIAPAGAEPGEVEAQHANAFFRQLTRDAGGRQPVLAAGEAMREQCVGDRFAVWQIERRRQLVTVGSRKLKAFNRHVGSSWSGRTLNLTTCASTH